MVSAVTYYGPVPLVGQPDASTASAVAPSSASSADSQGNIKAVNDPDKGFTFSDFLDVLNPLQHIPLVNALYRRMTGDSEGAVADVVGGALYGGVIGLGAAVVDLVVKDSTGAGVSDHMIALFDGGSSTPAAGQAVVAQAGTPAAASPGAARPAAQAAALSPSQPASGLPTGSAAAPAAAFAATAAASAAAAATAGRNGHSSLPDKTPPAAGGTAEGVSLSVAPTVAGATLPGAAGGLVSFDDHPLGTSLPVGSLNGAAPAAAPATHTAGTEATAPRFLPTPARIGPDSARQVMPMATTGPNAVTGTRRLSASTPDPLLAQAQLPNWPGEAATQGGGAGTPSGNSDQGKARAENAQWFNASFMKAMDKYQKGAQISGSP